MTDTKIPQLVLNELTKKQYDSITPQANEFYMTDEQYSEIPILFGQWADNQPGDNWICVSDEFVSSTDYPVVWDAINGILNKELYIEGVKVCTVEQAERILSGTQIWERTTGEQKLAEYYIVDLTNATFKFPRIIPEKRCIGYNDVAVISDASNYNGAYTISNSGKYFEFGAFIRLEKKTKNIDGITYNYHKPTQWNDPTTELPTLEKADTHKCKYVEGITATLANELINDKYLCEFFTCIDMGEVEDFESQYKICGSYPSFHNDIERSSTEFSANLCIYDQEIDDPETMRNLIPDSCDDAIVTYIIQGYVNPPAISEYNLPQRLYIKVV